MEIAKILCIAISTPDLHAVNNCLYGLYYLIDNPESNGIIHLIIESGACMHIIKTIGYNPSLTGIIIKVIGNMLTGNSDDVDEMLNYGVLDLLEYNLKNYGNALVEKEVLWAISNITAGSQSQIFAFMKSNLLGILLDKIKHTKAVVLMIELVWLFSNAITGGGIEIACELIKFGIIEIYLYVLENFDTEVIVIVTLEGLRSLFRYGEMVKTLTTDKNQIVESFCKLGGISYFENLSLCNKVEVCMKVEQIIKEYFVNE